MRVCGVDVRDVTQRSLRSVVSCVSQDTVLFNQTVRYNLSYGAPDATDAQLRAACRVARVDSYVGRLEAGFETVVGERGLRLSGGEKQRLGIARALLREPAVLVLDEATSALDSETEREVQAALDAAARGRCTLSIAHRLSTIVGCDEVVVMRDGVAVERGTHEQLLRVAGGLYAAMWATQSEAQKRRGGADGVPSSLDRPLPPPATAGAPIAQGTPPLQPSPPPEGAKAALASRAVVGTAVGLDSKFDGFDGFTPSERGIGGDRSGGGDGGGDPGGSGERGDASADGGSSVPALANADERAKLDLRFLVDLWRLVHIGTGRHPLGVLLCELGCVTALTALALWLLLPAANFALSDHQGHAHKLEGAAIIGGVVVVSLIVPLAHLARRRGAGATGEGRGRGKAEGGGGGGGEPAASASLAAHLQRRSLPLLFLSVQMYNVAGFFISIVPSLIYQALADVENEAHLADQPGPKGAGWPRMAEAWGCSGPESATAGAAWRRTWSN